jgi:hypothetical protein
MVCRRRESCAAEIQRVTCEIALRSPEPDDRVIDGQSILLLNASLNRLMMRSQSSGDGKERWIFVVTQQYTDSFNPTRRFSPRLRNRHQLRHIRIGDRQLNHPRHAVMTFEPCPANQRPG